MDIMNGNIYEAMRVILPEHRDLIERIEQNMTRQKQPELTEDAWEEIQYVLSEEIEQQLPVIKLFGEFGNTEVVGNPRMVHDRLIIEKDG